MSPSLQHLCRQWKRLSSRPFAGLVRQTTNSVSLALFDNAGRAAPFEERRNQNLAAVVDDNIRANNGLNGVVAAFNEQIRNETINEFFRRIFVESFDSAYRLQTQ